MCNRRRRTGEGCIRSLVPNGLWQNDSFFSVSPFSFFKLINTMAVVAVIPSNIDLCSKPVKSIITITVLRVMGVNCRALVIGLFVTSMTWIKRIGFASSTGLWRIWNFFENDIKIDRSTKMMIFSRIYMKLRRNRRDERFKLKFKSKISLILSNFN